MGNCCSSNSPRKRPVNSHTDGNGGTVGRHPYPAGPNDFSSFGRPINTSLGELSFK